MATQMNNLKFTVAGELMLHFFYSIICFNITCLQVCTHSNMCCNNIVIIV